MSSAHIFLICLVLWNYKEAKEIFLQICILSLCIENRQKTCERWQWVKGIRQHFKHRLVESRVRDGDRDKVIYILRRSAVDFSWKLWTLNSLLTDFQWFRSAIKVSTPSKQKKKHSCFTRIETITRKFSSVVYRKTTYFSLNAALFFVIREKNLYFTILIRAAFLALHRKMIILLLLMTARQ